MLHQLCAVRSKLFLVDADHAILLVLHSDFSPNKPCEAVRCEQQRWAFYEAEKDFWIVLVREMWSAVDSLTTRRLQHHTAVVDLMLCTHARTQVVKNPSVARDLDPITNKPSTEYLEEELEDSVLQSIIRRAYSLFRVRRERVQINSNCDEAAICAVSTCTVSISLDARVLCVGITVVQWTVPRRGCHGEYRGASHSAVRLHALLHSDGAFQAASILH